MVHRLYLDLSNYVSPLSGFFPVFLLSRSWISCLSIRWVIGLSGMVLFPSGIQFVGTVFSSPFSLLFLSFFLLFCSSIADFFFFFFFHLWRNLCQIWGRGRAIIRLIVEAVFGSVSVLAQKRGNSVHWSDGLNRWRMTKLAPVDRRNRRKHSRSRSISRVLTRHAARLDFREESFIYIRWAQEFRVPSLASLYASPRRRRRRKRRKKEE